MADSSAKVALVNQTFAKKFGLGNDAVGKLMGSGDGYRSQLDMTIVGVVEDAKYSGWIRVYPSKARDPSRAGPQQHVSRSHGDDAFGGIRAAGDAARAIGLYGVLAYTVAQRTRQISLRMALGAAPDRIRGMVLQQVAIMTLVGLAGALGAGKGAQSMLFQTGADPAVLALSAVALALVALCAGFIPAHRASRVDRMWALKYE